MENRFSTNCDDRLCISNSSHGTVIPQNTRTHGSTSSYEGKPGIGLRTRCNRRPAHMMVERSRLKRQTLQDMARPLKAWLYEHKDHPYPTKTEKLLLALGSHMTLIQVSNWFANARRRLKNTVCQPDLSWSARFKLYNKHPAGNAERLSISSHEGSLSDLDLYNDGDQNVFSEEVNRLRRDSEQTFSSHAPSTSSSVDHQPLPDHLKNATHKYKQTILHRYLNDSVKHAHICQPGRYPASVYEEQSLSVLEKSKSRDLCPVLSSGSLSSHDYEDVTQSPQENSSMEWEATFLDESLIKTLDKKYRSSEISQEDVDTYWMEIDAALALTNMSRVRLKPIDS